MDLKETDEGTWKQTSVSNGPIWYHITHFQPEIISFLISSGLNNCGCYSHPPLSTIPSWNSSVENIYGSLQISICNRQMRLRPPFIIATFPKEQISTDQGLKFFVAILFLSSQLIHLSSIFNLSEGNHDAHVESGSSKHFEGRVSMAEEMRSIFT